VGVGRPHLDHITQDNRGESVTVEDNPKAPHTCSFLLTSQVVELGLTDPGNRLSGFVHLPPCYT